MTMTNNNNWRSVCGLLVGLSLGIAATATVQADEAAPPSRTAAKDHGKKDRFFELRIYTAAPGKLDALNKRFRDHTLKFFEKYGIENIGYWTAVDDQNVGKLYYIVAYPDRASREKSLINGIAKDPAFLAVVAESEKDGKIVTGIESVLLEPTDYSAIK
jgi:hypothetical protein